MEFKRRKPNLKWPKIPIVIPKKRSLHDLYDMTNGMKLVTTDVPRGEISKEWEAYRRRLLKRGVQPDEVPLPKLRSRDQGRFSRGKQKGVSKVQGNNDSAEREFTRSKGFKRRKKERKSWR